MAVSQVFLHFSDIDNATFGKLLKLSIVYISTIHSHDIPLAESRWFEHE